MDFNAIEHIEQYLNKQLNSSDLKAFEQQLKTNPELAQELETFKAAQNAVIMQERLFLKQKLVRTHKKFLFRKFKPYLIAAVALILIGGGVLIHSLSNRSIETNPIQSDDTYVDQSQIDNNNVAVLEETKDAHIQRTGSMNKEALPNTKESNESASNSSTTVSNTDHKTNDVPTNSQPGKDNTVLSNPVIAFTVQNASGCAPLTCRFIDSSASLNKQKIVAYKWEFGDGSSSSAINPDHIYNQEGTYSVNLTVWDENGNSASKTIPDAIRVLRSPVASFTPSCTRTLLDEAHIQFENTSENLIPESTFNWDFGDHLGQSKEKSPHYTYSDTGTFNITLSVSNSNTCQSKSTAQIQVLANVSFFAPNIFSPTEAKYSDNRVYKVVASSITEFHMLIFSRNGELMYESHDYNTHGWDGNGSNGSAPLGVYVYKVKVKGLDGNYYDFKGTLTLVR